MRIVRKGSTAVDFTAECEWLGSGGFRTYAGARSTSGTGSLSAS
jgi:hypothetical protein